MRALIPTVRRLLHKAHVAVTMGAEMGYEITREAARKEVGGPEHNGELDDTIGLLSLYGDLAQIVADAPSRLERHVVLRDLYEQETEATGFNELAFVDAAEGDATNWWAPPKFDEERDNGRNAAHIMGMVSGIQFVAFAKGPEKSSFSFSEALGNVVEHMTGVKLDRMQRSFFAAILDHLAGRTSPVLTLPHGEVVVKAMDEEAEPADAAA